MRRVTYSMSVSLDGYITDPAGGIDWGTPNEEVHRFANDEVRHLDVHIMGRRLYETMLYWETYGSGGSRGSGGSIDDVGTEFASLWNPLPKLVFSNTLTTVEGNAELASGDLLEEIRRLRSAPGDGNIAIGGATLAHAVAGVGLIDDYRLRVCPVLLGGGTPYFSRGEQRADLELVETRTFDSGVVFMHYRSGD